MGYQIACGDVVDVLRDVPDETYNGCFCDPPYGLSSNKAQSLQDRLTGILPKIMLPNLNKLDAQAIQKIDFGSVSLSGSELSRREAVAVVKSGVGVPESTVHLNNGVMSGQKEIGTSGVSASGQISNSVLVDGIDAEGCKFLGDYVLYLGDSGKLAGSNSGSSFMAEFFSSGFAVPIVPQLTPGDPCPLARLCSVVLADKPVGGFDNSLGEANAAPFVLTSGGAVNTFMLRFDVGNSAIKLFATYRASHDSAIAEATSPKLIRAFSAASGLPSMFKPVRVSLIGFAADGADSVYFHLWLPEEWTDILDSIIPSGGFMGKNWDATLPDVEVWKQIYRTMKPGAILMAFGGTRTWHRLAVNIEDAGFEMFDTLMWLHGQGFPKSQDIGKAIDKEAGASREVVGTTSRCIGPSQKAGYQNTATFRESASNPGNLLTAPATDAARTWAGYGSALKPAWEPILCFRKPRTATYAQTAITHGTAAINVDGCRIALDGTEDLDGRQVNFNRMGYRGAEATSGTATYNAQGRWPANVILDEFSAAALDEMSGVLAPGGQVRGTEKSASTKFSYEGGYLQRSAVMRSDTGGASRFFYCAKASRSERNAGLEGLPERDSMKWSGGSEKMSGIAGAYPDGTPRPVQYQQNSHPCVKPLALCEYLARLIVPPVEYREAARLLVPFSGSGSEMIGALMAGWLNVDGIEMNADYVEIARRRLDAQVQMKAETMPLFAIGVD